MSENKKVSLGLEELNGQFLKPNQGKKKQKGIHRIPKRLVLAVAAVLITGMAAFGIYRLAAARNSRIDTYSRISSEKEYQEQYEKLMSEEKYIGVNRQIYMEGKRAQVGLINAAGNNFPMSFKIYDQEDEKVYYESGMIMPGSIQHIAVLKEEIEAPDQLALDYIIYGKDGQEEGTFTANVDFQKVDQ